MKREKNKRMKEKKNIDWLFEDGIEKDDFIFLYIHYWWVHLWYLQQQIYHKLW